MYHFYSGRTLILAALSLLFICAGAFGADRPEWKPVTKAELEMTEPVIQPGADAEAIFWEVIYNDKSGLKLEISHYVRIKIFTERGREQYSRFNIEFGNETKVSDIAARVVNPSGEIHEIRESDIFQQDILKAGRFKIRAKSFALPKLGPGSIFEYQFRESHRFGFLATYRLLFQKEIPVQRASYYVKPERGSDIEIIPFNMDKGLEFKKAIDRKGYLVVSQTNLPAIVEEPYMPPREQISRWAYIRYKEKGSRNSQNPINVEHLAGLVNAASFDDFTKPDERIREKAQALTEGASDEEEKLRRFYRFAQTGIVNFLYPRGKEAEDGKMYDVARDAGDVLKEGAGFPSNIDMLFASLARAEGFEARIVMASDRRRHFLDPEAHDKARSFSVCCVAVNIEGTWKYFRPGVPYVPFGHINWYRQSVPARLYGPSEYRRTTIPVAPARSSLARRTGSLTIDEDGTLSGDISIEYTGQLALLRRGEDWYRSGESVLEGYEREFTGWFPSAEIRDLKVENRFESEEPLRYTFHLTVPNYVQRTQTRVIFQPGVFEFGRTAVFPSEQRKYDIHFPFAWAELDELTISFPEGFELENTTSPNTVADRNGLASLRISLSAEMSERKIRYRRDFHFGEGTVLFKASAYPAIKKLFDLFLQSDQHVIALRRSGS